MSKVSIVVLSYNRRDQLAHTLGQLNRVDYPHLELIVVDNASTDDSPEMVRSHYPHVHLITSEHNVGIKGFNVGVAASQGDVIIVLDDDSYIEPDSVPLAVDRLLSDPDIGVIAFRIVLKDGRTITSNWPVLVPSFWGCGAAIRRSVWDQVGGYDPDFFLYLNEIDMAIRVWQSGYKVFYDDRCVAHHMVSKQNRASGRLIYYSARNVVWFHLKHIPWRFMIRTLSADLLSYLSLSILARRPHHWGRGVYAGLKGGQLALNKREPVSAEVVQFYLDSAFMWQWPHRQWLGKRRSGGLNLDPRDA